MAQWKRNHRPVSGKRTGKLGVHALLRVTHRHRAERIAVVGILQVSNVAPCSAPAIHMVLKSHLNRHLNADAPTFAEKDTRPGPPRVGGIRRIRLISAFVVVIPRNGSDRRKAACQH